MQFPAGMRAAAGEASSPVQWTWGQLLFHRRRFHDGGGSGDHGVYREVLTGDLSIRMCLWLFCATIAQRESFIGGLSHESYFSSRI
jgi:hypothetical protein